MWWAGECGTGKFGKGRAGPRAAVSLLQSLNLCAVDELLGMQHDRSGCAA